jgi:hypothetical protein
MKLKKLGFWVIVGMICCLIIVWVGFVYSDQYQILPDPSTVKSITAKIDNSRRKLPNIPVFDVPREDIPIILQCLEPAEREFMAPNWPLVGELKLTTDRGMEIEVHLFWTDAQRGAFAVGPWGRQHYYRAGNDSKTEDMIRNAYAKTLKK